MMHSLHTCSASDIFTVNEVADCKAVIGNLVHRFMMKLTISKQCVKKYCQVRKVVLYSAVSSPLDRSKRFTLFDLVYVHPALDDIGQGYGMSTIMVDGVCSLLFSPVLYCTISPTGCLYNPTILLTIMFCMVDSEIEVIRTYIQHVFEPTWLKCSCGVSKGAVLEPYLL